MISLLSVNVLHNRQAKRIFNIHDYTLFVSLKGWKCHQAAWKIRRPLKTNRGTERWNGKQILKANRFMISDLSRNVIDRKDPMLPCFTLEIFRHLLMWRDSQDACDVVLMSFQIDTWPRNLVKTEIPLSQGNSKRMSLLWVIYYGNVIALGMVGAIRGAFFMLQFQKVVSSLSEYFEHKSSYVPVNSKTAHPPPPGNPRAFDSR